MAYGISEFPSTNTYDSDLKEILRLYRELSLKYDNFLTIVEELEKKWEQIDGKITEEVEKATENIIAEVNGIVDALENKVNADIETTLKYVNDTVKTLNERMDRLNAAIENALAEVDKALEEIDGKIETEIGKYDKEIQSEINHMTDGLWEEIRKLNERLENITKEYPPTINPITGLKEPLDIVLSEMWYWMRVYGITAFEYDSLGLTAKEYDNLRLTAIEYDYFAKLYLMNWLENKMIDPTSGEDSTTQKTIYSVDRNTAIYSATSSLFDNMDFIAQKLDSNELTAYLYDYYASGFLSKTATDKWAFKIAPHTYQFTQSIKLNIENGVPTTEVPTFQPKIITDNATVETATLNNIITNNNNLMSSNGMMSIDLQSLIFNSAIYPLGFKTYEEFEAYVKNRLGIETLNGEWIVTINYVFVIQ